MSADESSSNSDKSSMKRKRTDDGEGWLMIAIIKKLTVFVYNIDIYLKE